jgi:hypothetical protein
MHLVAYAVSLALMSTGPQFPQSSPTVAEIVARLGEIDLEVSDRSTPDRALRSYFHYLNSASEISCLTSVMWKTVSSVGTPSHSEVREMGDEIRNDHFGGLALRVLERSYDKTFAECMASRDSYSYEITGVEPTPAATKFTVRVRNTTPIPTDAPRTAYSVESREAGAVLRIEYRQAGSEWKIYQIEEWDIYSESWRPQFDGDDLLPLFPSFVPARPF